MSGPFLLSLSAAIEAGVEDDIVLLHLVCADVEFAPCWRRRRETALIALRRAIRKIAGAVIDGGAMTQQRVRPRRAAVVAQWPEQRASDDHSRGKRASCSSDQIGRPRDVGAGYSAEVVAVSDVGIVGHQRVVHNEVAP